jgi:5-methyltetrahydropteroyltriglutamate--homocysteine methyltransferase
MAIPTEQIGSIPRPPQLLESIKSFEAGGITAKALERLYEEALCETIIRLEQTDSPVITDGEQTKPSFATYPLTGLQNLAPDGVVIPFADGHQRQLPRLTGGPFRYGVHADTYTRAARNYTKRPVKQAVISASALSLLYPGMVFPATHAKNSSRTSLMKPKPTYEALSMQVLRLFRSTSPKADSR